MDHVVDEYSTFELQFRITLPHDQPKLQNPSKDRWKRRGP